MIVETFQKKLTILLVEDNPADVVFIKEAIEESQVAEKVLVVSDGEKAMQYLRRLAPWAEVPRPDLMIIDLNLPRMDGSEVLAELQQDSNLSTMPIALLSGSPKGVYGCHFMLTSRCTWAAKTPDFHKLVAIVKGFADFALKQAAS